MPADVAHAADEGRSVQHVLTGLAITAGAVALSAVLAKLFAPPEDAYEAYSDYEPAEGPPEPPKRGLFAMVWPSMFLALTLSGLRIWNAPRSPARTQALTLWGMTQALNAAWMALGPARLGGQVATGVASLTAAIAYAWRAWRVDPSLAGLAAPYVGWAGVANAVKDSFTRPEPAPTVH